MIKMLNALEKVQDQMNDVIREIKKHPMKVLKSEKKTVQSYRIIVKALQL
jgi:hypothetical protein